MIVLRAFLAAILLVFHIGSAHAAIVVTPSVNGLTRVSSIPVGLDGHMRYQGQGTWDPVSRSYVTTGRTSVAGRAIALAAKVPLAATAGSMAISAMRVTPLGLAGTLAATWLLSEGLEYLAGEWQSSTQTFTTNINPCLGPATQSALVACLQANKPGYTWSIQFVSAYNAWRVFRNTTEFGFASIVGATNQPATDSDFASLPDPVPSVGSELPSAPYMPEGAPVDFPEYEPADVPIGEPYQRPDGSTVQDRARITPAGGGNVSIVIYNITTIDSAGNPVSEPVPVEEPEAQQDQCEKYPDSVGCAELGDYNHAIPTASHEFVFEPEAVAITGQCPAPIPVLGHELSFDAACSAMESIRPIVIGMAAVMASLILFGSMRGAD